MRLLLTRVLLPVVLLGVGFLAVSPPAFGDPPGSNDVASASVDAPIPGGTLIDVTAGSLPDQPLTGSGQATAQAPPAPVFISPVDCLNVLDKHQAYLGLPNPFSPSSPNIVVLINSNSNTYVLWNNVTSTGACATPSALGPPTSKGPAFIFQITDG